MQSALEKMNENENEYDVFGKFVSVELKSIENKKDRDFLKRKLNKIILDYKDEVCDYIFIFNNIYFITKLFFFCSNRSICAHLNKELKQTNKHHKTDSIIHNSQIQCSEIQMKICLRHTHNFNSFENFRKKSCFEYI